jgi:hypothetical protein
MKRRGKPFLFGGVMGFALGSQILVAILALPSGWVVEHRRYWAAFLSGAGLTLFLAYLLFAVLGWSGILQRMMNTPSVPTRASMRSLALGIFSGVGVFGMMVVAVLSTIVMLSG